MLGADAAVSTIRMEARSSERMGFFRPQYASGGRKKA
jgi:hypothetical protein